MNVRELSLSRGLAAAFLASDWTERDMAHLRGRVAWFAHVHPVRGARLRSTFNRIVW